MDLIDPVFITMRPRDFLRAVFRGGRDRLTFVISLAHHLAPTRADGSTILADATASSGDPLDRAALCAIAALSFQLSLFDEARANAGWDDARIVDYVEIDRDPVVIANRVAQIFSSDLLPSNTDTVTGILGQDAKSPHMRFARASRASNDAAIDLHHAPRIDRAITWAIRRGLPL